MANQHKHPYDHFAEPRDKSLWGDFAGFAVKNLGRGLWTTGFM